MFRLRLKPTGNPPVGLLSICPEPKSLVRRDCLRLQRKSRASSNDAYRCAAQHSHLRWDRSPSLARNSRLECATPESDTGRVTRGRSIRSMFIQPHMRAVNSSCSGYSLKCENWLLIAEALIQPSLHDPFVEWNLPGDSYTCQL